MEIKGIQCPKCNDKIYSRARHDCRYCSCGYCFIDGGFDYARVGFGLDGDKNTIPPLNVDIILPNEVTAKILKKGIKILELPIRYNPRDKKHGKKINWKDGLMAIWTLFKYRFND